MGCSPFKVSSSTYDAPRPAPIPTGNPDPKNFVIMKESRFGEALALEVRYPDCRNYEGRKIMVYRAVSSDEILRRNQGTMDPHFSGNLFRMSPVARFEPTAEGWAMAVALAKFLSAPG